MHTSSLIEVIPVGDGGGFRAFFGGNSDQTCSEVVARLLIEQSVITQKPVSPSTEHREAA